MFGQTHSKVNLRQLGVEREFQLQHSDEGTTVMSECRKLAHFPPVPFRLKGKHRAHSIVLSMCESLCICTYVCDSGSYTVALDTWYY